MTQHYQMRRHSDIPLDTSIKKDPLCGTSIAVEPDSIVITLQVKDTQ